MPLEDVETTWFGISTTLVPRKIVLFDDQLGNDLPHPSSFSRTGVNSFDRGQGFLRQGRHGLFAVFEAARVLHAGDCILLDLIVACSLLQNVDQLQVLRVRPDAVNDGEREFPFCEIFAEAFVVGIIRAGEVHVVIAYLEDQTDEVNESYAVPIASSVDWYSG